MVPINFIYSDSYSPFVHGQGVLVSVGGLGMLVASDHLTNKDYPAVNMVKGDMFVSICTTDIFDISGMF